MPERPTTDPDGVHPTDEQLRHHLDDRLPPADATAVGDHLDGCAACLARLDDLGDGRPAVARTELPDAPSFDAKGMRRAVRRTLWRTAINAVALLVAGIIVLQLLGTLLIHPLVVGRGDRVADHVAATVDLPVMTIPGAEVREVNSSIGWIRRTTEVELSRTLGAGSVAIGGYTTQLGPLATSVAGGGMVFAEGPPLRGGGATDGTEIELDAERLPDGTAVTVELRFERPVAMADVDALADDEVALLWVGFDLPGGDPMAPTSRLGYSACGVLPDVIDRQAGSGFSSGFGSSGVFRRFPPEQGGGADHALGQLRRAVTNLAALGWPDDGALDGTPLGDLEATAAYLDATEPEVVSAVVTGPTPEVAAVLEGSDAQRAVLLDVDFDRGAAEPCG